MNDLILPFLGVLVIGFFANQLMNQISKPKKKRKKWVRPETNSKKKI